MSADLTAIRGFILVTAIILTGGLSAAAADPLGPVILQFGRKLGPKDGGYKEGYESYVLRFGPGDWAGTTVKLASAWGDGDGKDLWGWTGGAEDAISEVTKDATGYFFIYSLKTAGSSTWVAANFRLERKDGSPAVAQARFRYDGKGEPVGSNAPKAADPLVEKRARDTVARLGGEIARDEFSSGLRVELTSKKVTDADLAAIAGLPGLENLQLAFTPVTDAGLAHLKEASTLRVLVLWDTKVTDRGLAHLSGLTKLSILNVKGTQVSATGIDALKKALPKLDVIR